MILGTGHLTQKPDRHTRTGAAHFDGRGDVALTLTDARREAAGWVARLRVRRGEQIIGETEMHLTYVTPYIDAPEVTTDMHWRGEIVIEGYPMRVSIDPQSWGVRFFNDPARSA